MLELAEFKHQKEQERRNKKLVEHYWNGKWNERRTEILDECLSSNVRYHGTSMTINGIEEYKQVYQSYLAAFGKSELEITELIAAGDKVVSRISLSCLHTGELDGIPPGGKEIKLTVFTIFKLQDGKIAEEWEILDELGMMQQLGLELTMKKNFS